MGNIEQIFYKNYKRSITFKNCESLYCTPVTYNIRHQLYVNKKKLNQCRKKKRETHFEHVKCETTIRHSDQDVR